MKKLFTIILAVACFTASAQTEYPYPWNPDADLDGWVSASDLLELLAVFGGEFAPDTWETDSTSAAVILDGNHGYFQCQSLCNSIEGRWRMADLDAFGRHFDLVSNDDGNFWVNSNDLLNATATEVSAMLLNGGSGNLYYENPVNLSQAKKCLCYIQASPFVPNQIASDTESNDADLTPCEGQSAVNFNGYDYELVEIGGQCWFAENLQTTSFSNGDELPHQSELGSWSQLPSFVYPDGDFSTVSDLGLLYNWNSIGDPRGLCPVGFRVPMKVDFEHLIEYSGGADFGGSALRAAENLSNEGFWQTATYFSTNSSGFTAQPAGLGTNSILYFNFSQQANFWARELEGGNGAILQINAESYGAVQTVASIGDWLSVRCIKD